VIPVDRKVLPSRLPDGEALGARDADADGVPPPPPQAARAIVARSPAVRVRLWRIVVVTLV
jgi:hypothetical protein